MSQASETAKPVRRRHRPLVKALAAVLAALAAYVVLELLVSTLAWVRWWDSSLVLFENSGQTWRFDPVRGYRLGPTPSRFTRITNGRVEYVGRAQGNAQGFPDRDDFTDDPTVPRYAVFGDSFTEAQYLDVSWPDRMEDLARARGQAVEFRNYGVSGGGLANWWSVITHELSRDPAPFEGVIFAVFAGDLERTFTMWDHQAPPHPRFGRVPGWDPATYPASLEEARPLLRPQETLWIVSADEFENALGGRWPAAIPHPFQPFVFNATRQVARRLLGRAQPGLPRASRAANDPARAVLISQIGDRLKERGIPVLVVHLADRDSLLDPARAPTWPLEQAREFARSLGAPLLDGTELFANLSPAQIRGLFLPYDGHWNQQGSDRFAELLDRRLPVWFPPRAPAEGSVQTGPSPSGTPSH